MGVGLNRNSKIITKKLYKFNKSYYFWTVQRAQIGQSGISCEFSLNDVCGFALLKNVELAGK